MPANGAFGVKLEGSVKEPFNAKGYEVRGGQVAPSILASLRNANP